MFYKDVHLDISQLGRDCGEFGPDARSTGPVMKAQGGAFAAARASIRALQTVAGLSFLPTPEGTEAIPARPSDELFSLF